MFMNSHLKQYVLPICYGNFTLPPYDINAPELLGGFCNVCNRYFFPRSLFCPYCLGNLDEVCIGNEGSIYSYTIVRIKPPFGLPSPYSVGYIDLKRINLRIFCLLDPTQINLLQINMSVILVVAPFGCDENGNSRLRPYFTPKSNT